VLKCFADKPSLLIGDRVESFDGLRRGTALNCIVRPVRWMRGGRRAGFPAGSRGGEADPLGSARDRAARRDSIRFYGGGNLPSEA
jgi:hypothetical protein